VQPSGLPFRVVPFVGAPGAGKALLVRALAGHAARWDATSVSMPRQVRIGAHASTAVDVRLPGAVVELVYFDDARAEAALIGSAPFHAAVLVVSGVDSIQPGTWDSIMQTREKGVRFALAVVTRCGEVEDPELLDLVKLEVGETLQKHLGRDGGEIPVIGVDAHQAMAGMPQWGESMGSVLRVLGG
jgi:hypothetical protein